MTLTTFSRRAPFVTQLKVLWCQNPYTHIWAMGATSTKHTITARIEQRYHIKQSVKRSSNISSLLPQQLSKSTECYRSPMLSMNNLFCAHFSTKSSTHCANKTDTKASSTTAADLFGDTANLGLFAKFKHMYKKYWYVLIPVHVVTSVGWFGAFYYLSKCGVDVPSVLQHVHLSETIIEKVQGSDMGHYAIAYLCYKVATPLRYAVTLGGTTISIKYLVQAGHIKPMPSKHELMTMYNKKKLYKDKQLATTSHKTSADTNSETKKHK